MKPTPQAVLDSEEVHYFTKEIIKKALTLDPVDAIHDIELALRAMQNHLDSFMRKPS